MTQQRLPMTFTWNHSKAKYIVTALCILNTFAADNIVDGILMSPLLLVSLITVSIVPTRVVIVAPQDLESAMDTLDFIRDNENPSIQIGVFDGSINRFDLSDYTNAD